MEPLSLEWKTVDGLRLTVRNWEPEIEPQALTCLVHGLGEHSGRYNHLGSYLKGPATPSWPSISAATAAPRDKGGLYTWKLK